MDYGGFANPGAGRTLPPKRSQNQKNQRSISGWPSMHTSVHPDNHFISSVKEAGSALVLVFTSLDSDFSRHFKTTTFHAVWYRKKSFAR